MDKNILDIFCGQEYAKFCMFFITTIYDEIQKAKIFEKNASLNLTLYAWHYPYRYDVVTFVRNAFKRIGYDIKYPKYEVIREQERDKYKYVWEITKK